MSSVCRACLAGDVRMYSLENYPKEIYEKLTNSKLSRGPQAVCCACHSLLQRCHRFTEMARCSESTLQYLLNTGIEISHENIVKLNPALKNTQSAASMQVTTLDNIKNNVDSPHVIEVFVTSEEQKVLKEEFMEEEPVFTAVDFPAMINGESKQPMEYLTESTLSQSSETKENEDKSTDRFRYTSQNIDSLDSYEFIDKKNFECNHCGKIFFQKKELSAHIQTHSQFTIACDICNQKYTSNYYLKRHLNTHKKERTYACAVCDEIFSKNSQLTRHKKTHKENKPYACDVCDKTFSYNSQFVAHKRIHTGERTFSCDICDKKFSRKSTLTVHIRIHTGEKPFACNVCDKIFSQKTNLTQHLKSHTGEKPYACHICDTMFFQKSHLTQHMGTHTGERPYACNLCDKIFTRKSHLTGHLRTHTGERPYACDVCDTMFFQRSHLIGHMRIHTRDKPYACDVCDKKFTQKNNLIAHMGSYLHKKKTAKCESDSPMKGSVAASNII